MTQNGPSSGAVIAGVLLILAGACLLLVGGSCTVIWGSFLVDGASSAYGGGPMGAIMALVSLAFAGLGVFAIVKGIGLFRRHDGGGTGA
jgi:hypothetical protein